MSSERIERIIKAKKLSGISWNEMADGLPVQGNSLRISFDRGNVNDVFLDHIEAKLIPNEAVKFAGLFKEERAKSAISTIKEGDYNPYELMDQVAAHPRGVEAIVGYLADHYEDLKAHSLFDLFLKGVKAEVRNEIKVEEILKVLERRKPKDE